MWAAYRAHVTARDRRIDPRDAARFRAALATAPREQGRFEWLLRWVMRAWCRVVDWRVSVSWEAGLPAVTTPRPGSGCVVACAPHRTWVEPFLLLAAWPEEAAHLVWLADGATVTRSWWRRRLLPRLGILPIEGRAGGPATYLEAGVAALAAGAALVVFPEKGPASPPERTRPLASGFAYLARRAGAPVVPVVVAGTHDIRRGSRFSVTFLAPMMAEAPDPAALSAASRSLAHALTSRTAEAIDTELPHRNALIDARLPARARWTWLGRLFH
jgi:1-acyl-sn-glycerol-3-phosphate acyltransferase